MLTKILITVAIIANSSSLLYSIYFKNPVAEQKEQQKEQVSQDIAPQKDEVKKNQTQIVIHKEEGLTHYEINNIIKSSNDKIEFTIFDHETQTQQKIYLSGEELFYMYKMEISKGLNPNEIQTVYENYVIYYLKKNPNIQFPKIVKHLKIDIYNYKNITNFSSLKEALEFHLKGKKI